MSPCPCILYITTCNHETTLNFDAGDPSEGQIKSNILKIKLHNRVSRLNKNQKTVVAQLMHYPHWSLSKKQVQCDDFIMNYHVQYSLNHILLNILYLRLIELKQDITACITKWYTVIITKYLRYLWETEIPDD